MRRHVEAVNGELRRLDTAKPEAEARRATARRIEKGYREAIVFRAVGDNVEVAPPEKTVAYLDDLLAATDDKIDEQERDLAHLKRAFKSSEKRVLEACVDRAADIYLQQSKKLIQTWRSLNDAQLMRGERELQWRQILIPALEGMPGAYVSRSRPVLIDAVCGNETDSPEKVEAELMALIA